MLNSSEKAPLILIVDDDVVTRMTLSKVLSKSGYQIIEATNGSEGFSLYIQHQPNLVLMDVMMPVMDGFKATQAIRNYEQNRAVPILMLTALDDIGSIDQAFDAGATDFVTKPINWGLLGQRVKYAIRSSLIEDQLRSSQAQLAYAQKLAKLGYWEWDAPNDEVSGSSSAFNLFGVPNQPGINLEQFLAHIMPKDLPLIHQAMGEATQGQSHLQISFRVLHHDGNIAHIECLGEVTYSSDGSVLKITGSAQDISRLHRAESIIDFQSHHDALTELPNRSTFSQVLQTALQDELAEKLTAVIIFDIDRFKHINDNLGQDKGDSLLISLAQRLKRITRDSDFVARLGSDEFAIHIKNLADINELNLLINRIVFDLKAPFIVQKQELFIGFSIGLSVYPDDAHNAETLINHANIARAVAKSKGGNQFEFYRAEMNAEAKELLLLENDLRRALDNGEIEVFYQPQVDAKTLLACGSEALVRWRHPVLGIVSPVTFIPIAESTGLIVDIGHFVLSTAIKQTLKWHEQGFNQLRIGINLSGRQFTQSNLMADVQRVLDHNPLPAKFIDLEITESLAMSDAEKNINILKGLKAMGVSISIDDFGTGYSSLAYLHSFPIDTIKIDRSFVMNLGNPEGQAIARTIIAMAESLNLEVVAEGIESDAQVSFLQSKHCDIFQGFKFGRPMPAPEFYDWLVKNQHTQPS
ncbi:EAL domain-containing protein [Thiomicrorhabdus aquaedulcis]|uniref:two-component system response regulator n=1 Tax=Thiomicrorhabdus aquaedulcis TaxID=2211106 RepID=UPI000FDCC6C4|nr:EAL domain-containing protein [Thiomicrorhabdus aquaedulcis]